MTIEQLVARYEKVLVKEFEVMFHRKPTKAELRSIFIKLLRQLDREESKSSYASAM